MRIGNIVKDRQRLFEATLVFSNISVMKALISTLLYQKAAIFRFKST